MVDVCCNRVTPGTCHLRHEAAMLIIVFALSLLGLFAPWVEGQYAELLELRPLPQSQLLAAFNFKANTTLSDFDAQNYRLFPRSLGQILQHTHARELHLRFSLGRWDAENWGQRPRHGRREGGTGVELWAWVDADSHEQANARWLTLSNALSGLFCASMNFIDSTKTIRPAMTFDLEGSHQNASTLHLLHGALPHEVICTENLTPFLKLLPCKGKAGISTLLDGHKLFDASWQTMAIDVRPICPPDGSECLLEIDQTVDMVLDLDRSMRSQNDPIPRPPPLEEIDCNTDKWYNNPDTCYPRERSTERAWTLSKVFGRPVRGSCHVNEGAAPESVILHTAAGQESEVTTEEPYAEHDSGDGLLRYVLPESGAFDIALGEQPLILPSTLEQPRLRAERTMVGYGQERGGMRIVLNNPSLTEAVDLVYLESLPWFMKPYLHTLHASINSVPSPSSIQQTFYRPAIDRARGTHLELRLHVPAGSSLVLTYDFEKAILRYTEYPPDANRGFDVAPSIVKLLSNSTDSHHNIPVYLRTTSMLLPLPTPDFSMPYNVIILTSTVMAMAFGSVFNLLVRRFVAADEVGPAGIVALKAKVQAAILNLKQKIQKNKAVRVADQHGENKKVR
ncbi:putative GPI transamidase component Gpi16 [Aureobasidium subglaciale]|nr:putative GPI transamidase component Gpi16 [Aureobasidium subglaciale]